MHKQDWEHSYSYGVIWKHTPVSVDRCCGTDNKTAALDLAVRLIATQSVSEVRVMERSKSSSSPPCAIFKL